MRGSTGSTKAGRSSSRLGWVVVVPIAVTAVGWLASLACSGESPSEEVRLRFHYEEGDTLRYVHHVEGRITRADTADAEARVDEYERSMRIEEVAREITPRDHIVLSLTYFVQPKAGAHGDTARAGDDGEASGDEEATAEKRVSLSVEITPRGRIVRVTGVEEAKRLFGDLDFQSMFEQSQPVFPERPLRPGDSWTQTVKVLSPSREPVETSSTYALKEITEIEGESIAVLDFDGDIYLPITFDPEVSPGGLQSVEQEIRLRGTIHFAHEKGVIRRVEHTADGTIRRVSLREGKPVRRSVRIDQDTTIRLVEER